MVLHGIQVEDSGTAVRVRMEGEFDLCSLRDLREGLDDACAFGRTAIVDLSGVTFLDLQSTRELVVRSVIQAHLLSFENPSSGVLTSLRALGMGASRSHPGHEEPPIFSEA